MKRRVITAVTILLLLCALSPFAAYNIHMCLSGQSGSCSIAPMTVLAGLANPKVQMFTFLCMAASVLAVVWLMIGDSYIKYRNGMRQVVPGLWTPDGAGQGQYGTARWLEPDEFGQIFSTVEVDMNAPLIRELMAHGADDLKGEVR